MLKISFEAPTPGSIKVANATDFIASYPDGYAGKHDHWILEAVNAVISGVRHSLDFVTESGGRLLILRPEKRQLNTTVSARHLGGRLAAALIEAGTTSARVSLPIDNELLAHSAFGAVLRAYSFDKFRSNPTHSLSQLVFETDDPEAAEQAFSRLVPLAEGVCISRDLSNEPGNILTPSEFADRSRKLSDLGIKVEVLETSDLARLGLNGLVSVGKGSIDGAKLAILEWAGPESEKTPLILVVGKGVTYDSGGLSLKTYAGTEYMNFDMGGAACVFGLLKSLALSKAPVRVIGALGLAENMPSGTAFRPGDILQCYNGVTVEVRNTDAEGRIVLGDSIAYCRDRYRPDAIIDAATLTGVCIRSLGYDYAGLLSNNNNLAKAIEAAAESVDERVWRLPLHPAFAAMNASSLADVSNLPWDRNGFFTAGVSAAAHFIEKFVGDTPWAHLDIAGPAFPRSQPTATAPVGAPGYGVLLLNHVVRTIARDGLGTTNQPVDC